MADNRTMAELLQAPTEGYEDAIVIPEIATNNFDLKHGLINLIQNKQFFRHDKEDPHAHIHYFNKITSTMRVPNKAQQLEPKLYDSNVIMNTCAIVIPDSEETLMLAEESRSKMLLKQHDPMILEKKVNTTPVDYAILNQLSQDLKKRFVPQTELSAEQAFWSQNSMNSSDPSPSRRPTKVNIPKELPKVSMEKDLVIIALRDEIRKLKGKDLADNFVIKHTIASEMLKVDMEPIASKLLNNRTVHSDYLRHTQEQAAILREVVEQGKSQNRINNSLDSALRLKTPIRRIRTDNGTKFVNQTLREYYEKVDISHETSVARSPQQNGVIERRNCTLIEAASIMLIYAKAPLFLWAKAVATACYTQNRSNIRLRHGKIPYELLHDNLLDLSFFHVFGAFYYPTNDSENLGKLPPKLDIDFNELTAMASKHGSLEPALHEMTPVTISSGLAPNLAHSTPNSQTSPETQSHVISNDVKEENHELYVAHMNNNPFFGISILENDFESSSSDVIPTVVHTSTPNSEHVNKLTKDHPLDNIISKLERPVSTRLQLHEQALCCYYDAFLTSVEPKTYKDALTQSCWIEAMQEELNKFERLEVL
nr:retrovirus-related Pol polyprotein from transposon TNT 1-94 [Tanacetum cinerariifolium]